MANDDTASDPVDVFIEQWRHERPELDPTPLGISSRLLMLYKHLEQSTDRALAPFGLTLWQFDVLAALRRSGEPFRLSPTQLIRSMTISSGAMTNRIDRLEEMALVQRLDDPEDRRGVLIALTFEGRRIVDQAITARLEEAKRLFVPFSPEETATLTNLLRQLLLFFDGQKIAPTRRKSGSEPEAGTSDQKLRPVNS